MKVVSIFALFLLIACATRPTLEELEAEALATGDWAAVERRERTQRRLGLPGTQKCREGFAFVCIKNGMNEFCSCEPLPTGN